MSTTGTTPVNRLALTLFALLSAVAASSAAPPEVELRHASSFGSLGGTTLTLWTDGYVEEVSTQQGGYRFSGQVPQGVLKSLVAELDETGLRSARFTQQPEHPVLTEGGEWLQVRAAKGLNALEKPAGLRKPNAETLALDETVQAFTARLREVLRPHLTEAGPAGRYAQAVPQSAELPDTGNLDDLPPALRAALTRIGSTVHLPEGQAPDLKQGQRMEAGGCTVAWVVSTLGTREPPGKAAK